jgi:hypothetical protein
MVTSATFLLILARTYLHPLLTVQLLLCPQRLQESKALTCLVHRAQGLRWGVF